MVPMAHICAESALTTAILPSSLLIDTALQKVELRLGRLRPRSARTARNRSGARNRSKARLEQHSDHLQARVISTDETNGDIQCFMIFM